MNGGGMGCVCVCFVLNGVCFFRCVAFRYACGSVFPNMLKKTR